MRKLYDLVKLRNTLLDKMHSLSLAPDIQGKIEILNLIVDQNKTVDNIDLLENLKDDFDRLAVENQKIINSLNTTVNIINQDIDNYALELFDNDAYREQFKEELIRETLYPSIEIENWVVSKITQYSDWHYPALQINPRSKKWLDTMVASDPLYLTHSNIATVKDMIKEYPELYQNRLRLYEIVDRNFSKLPVAQFGFVLCWDNFNHLSLDKIEKYIREVWKLLRSGGSFIFNYNNCDFEGPAYRAECYAGSYTSASWLTKLFTSIGYEITAFHDHETGDAFNTHISWVEVKKPGDLKTVKAAQAIAQILSK
jgi:SAM-dependent methyltransferase